MRTKKYIKHITCRVDGETDMMIERLTCSLEINKSELIRECIKLYYESIWLKHIFLKQKVLQGGFDEA